MIVSKRRIQRTPILDSISSSADLARAFAQGIEEVIVSKRRFAYEDQLRTNALQYDVWFDYVRLEEAAGEGRGGGGGGGGGEDEDDDNG